METSRDDVGIVIRSAFLKKETKQRFSLFALVIFSVVLIFLETIETKPLNYLRSFTKDIIYQSSVVISSPIKGSKIIINNIGDHINLFDKYKQLKSENIQLKEQIHDPEFLIFENNQLRKLLDEQAQSSTNLVSSRVMIDKQSPYLKSFIIKSGSNKKIKKGMAVLHGKNFIGKIVDVNFFSSRILLVTDLNSKIPVVVEPTGYNAILSGTGKSDPVLDFLPENHNAEPGNKIYTSGKEGIFLPGIPVGQIQTINEKVFVSLFSDLSQIMFVNISLRDSKDHNN